MAAHVNNFFFGMSKDARDIYRLVDFRQKNNEPFSLFGDIHHSRKYPDGSYIMTSPVKKVFKSVVRTESNSRYFIDSMHPDYKNFLDAIDSGYPIIYDWTMGQFGQRYSIRGKVLNPSSGNFTKDPDAFYEFHLVHDFGKYCTVINSYGVSTIFVDWTSMNDDLKREPTVDENGFLNSTDLAVKDFKRFCGIPCKPCINLKKI